MPRARSPGGGRRRALPDLQRVLPGLGDLHLRRDLALLGVGDHDVARPVFGQTGGATVRAGVLVGLDDVMALTTGEAVGGHLLALRGGLLLLARLAEPPVLAQARLLGRQTD